MRGTLECGHNTLDPVCYLCGTDIVRAFERQHPVQDGGCKGNLVCFGPVSARSVGIANYALVSTDRRLDLGRRLYPLAFCQAIRPRSAIIRRWRSRCVGAVSAEVLAIAARTNEMPSQYA
jgi:hypothetical protein